MKQSTINKRINKYAARVQAMQARKQAIYREALAPYMAELERLEAERFDLHSEYCHITCHKAATEFDEPRTTVEYGYPNAVIEGINTPAFRK